MIFSRLEYLSKLGANILGWHDALIAPIWFLLLLIMAYSIRKNRYGNDPAGIYFLPGLIVKLVGGLMVGLVYQFYYKGGDTINYFLTADGMVDAFLMDLSDWYYLMLGSFNANNEHYYVYAKLIDKHQSYMPYLNDAPAFMVSRFVFWASLFSFNSYMGAALLVSTFSYIGVWGLYRVLYYQFPKQYHSIAYAILFIPSVFFWGSGILKDSLTFGLLGLLMYNFYWILKKGIFQFWNWLVIIFASFAIFNIKAYILLSFMPFLMLWFAFDIRSRIKDGFVRVVITPVVAVLALGASLAALNSLGNVSERFATDKLLENASVVKEDLNRSAYYADGKGSSYDIGEFDGTIESAISLAPMAVITTFFRPFVWEVRNPLMLVASIESLALSFFFLQTFFYSGVFGFFRKIFSNPFLIFTFGYSVSFAFMVGLSTGNFGNLVRYKIPCIPFFVVTLFIIQNLCREETNAKKQKLAEDQTMRRKLVYEI